MISHKINFYRDICMRKWTSCLGGGGYSSHIFCLFLVRRWATPTEILLNQIQFTQDTLYIKYSLNYVLIVSQVFHVQTLIVSTSVYKHLTDRSAFVRMVFLSTRVLIKRAQISTNARRICALNCAKIKSGRLNALVTLHTMFYCLTMFPVKPEVCYVLFYFA